MLRRRMVIGFIVLLVFLVTIGCSSPAKKPLDNQISANLSKLKEDIKNNSWDSATSTVQEIQKDWKKAKPKYQINQKSDTITQFQKSLNRLSSNIKSRDKSSASAELEETITYWQEINKF